jgi:hypothetical protein
MNSSVHRRLLVKRKQLLETAAFCMAKGAWHIICTSDHPLPGHRINISLRACVESWYWSTLVSGVVSCTPKIRKRNHFRLSRLPRRELQRCLRDSRDIVLATPRTEKQGRRRSVALGIGIGDDLVLPLSVPQASAMYRHTTKSEMYFCHGGRQNRQVNRSYWALWHLPIEVE